MKKIAISTGDPAGIGPEITAKALRFYPLLSDCIYVVYGLFSPFTNGNEVEKIDNIDDAKNPNKIYWIKIGNSQIEIGKPSQESGKNAFEILERISKDLQQKKLDAVVTNPISKYAIQISHPEFIGHTEYFSRKFKAKNVIMSFWGRHFNLALLTTHLPISEVSQKIKRKYLLEKLQLIYHESKRLLNTPKMAILGVNPHAGENGAFGKEDEELKRTLGKLKDENIYIDGPFPADTFFSQKAEKYNLIISAYHDQGLIPFKMIHRNEGVNITLGLPFVRTSVDHGTAFDIVGKNIASEKSLETAIRFAEKLLGLRAENNAEIYGKFAPYYDEYMEHVDYQKWVNFVKMQVFNISGKLPEKTLELACGTANISTILTKNGWNVDASDISTEMLKIASEKNFSPHLFWKDMLFPIPANKYELILLLFDSINYLTDKKSVEKLFANVTTGLKNKGIFIFDISTVKNCRDNFNGFVDLLDNEQEYLINQGEFNEELSLQETKLTFFSKKGFLYDRYDELHRQKIFKTKEILELIEKSDLKLLGIYSADKPQNLLENLDNSIDELYSRLFFVLRKNAV